MATSSTPIFPKTIKSSVQQILPADASTLKTLYTGGADGSRIENIIISSTDTSARDLVFYITVGGTDYQICTVSCPINSGNTNAIFPLNLFQNVAFQGLCFDPNGNRYLYLDANATLKVKSATTVTAAKVIAFHIQAGDY